MSEHHTKGAPHHDPRKAFGKPLRHRLFPPGTGTPLFLRPGTRHRPEHPRRDQRRPPAGAPGPRHPHRHGPAIQAGRQAPHQCHRLAAPVQLFRFQAGLDPFPFRRRVSGRTGPPVHHGRLHPPAPEHALHRAAMGAAAQRPSRLRYHTGAAEQRRRHRHPQPTNCRRGTRKDRQRPGKIQGRVPPRRGHALHLLQLGRRSANGQRPLSAEHSGGASRLHRRLPPR